LTGFDISNQVSQFALLHGIGSSLVQNAWSSSRPRATGNGSG